MPQNVVLDTDVFSALYIDPERAERRGRPVTTWPEALGGVRVLISFQTRAELLSGAIVRGWGRRRTMELRDAIHRGAPGLSLLMGG